MRIDKFLSNMGCGSRKEIKSYIKKGLVKVNGYILKSASTHIDENLDEVFLNGKQVFYEEHVYYLMNKPKNTICANEDGFHKTVFSIMNKDDIRKDIHTVGRLDIDTTGLLIITNDGGFTHKVLSPKSNIYKKYLAIIEGKLFENAKEILKEGIFLEEENIITKPAILDIIDENKVELSICEGKFHQVKRMIKSVGGEVIELKRLSIGGLELKKDLKEGEYIKVTKEEFKVIGGDVFGK